MKIIIKYIYTSIILIVVFSAFSIISKAESNITTYLNKIYNEPLIKYIETKDIKVYVKETEILIKNNQKETIINEIYLDHIKCEDNIYIIVKNEFIKLYKISSNINDIKSINIMYDKVNDLTIYKDSIILVGSINNNSVISKYDLELNEEDELIFTGEGYQEFTHLLIVDEYIYVGGIKSAHSNNDFYLNVGNINDVKSFIFVLNSSFDIENYCYFNEGSSLEKIKSMNRYNDGISIMFECDKLYLFEIDLDLKSCNKKEIKTKKLDEIYTGKKNNNTHLYIYQDSVITRICYYDYNNNLCDLYSFEGEYIDYFVKDGVLNIYYIFDDKVFLKEINEYHDIYITPLICDYYNYDEKRMSHFLVDSYLEDLVFEQYLITPYFSRNLCGEYISKYKAERLNKEYVYIETPLIVQPYVNVIDGGIYNKGMRLYFFGNGKLNGESIINGHELITTGENILEITDANNLVYKYTFTVVEDYYNNDSIVNIKTDYIINKGEIVKLTINVQKDVEDIIINNESYRNFRLVNDILEIEISPNESDKIHNYSLDKIIYVDGTVDYINKIFNVKVNKEDVLFNISESLIDGSLNLDIDVIDKTKNIKDVYFEVYENNELVENLSTFIKDKKGVFSSLTGEITLKIFVNTYTSKDILLFTYKGDFNKVLDLNYDIIFSIEDGVIKNINISTYLNNENMKHKEISLLGEVKENLIEKYQVEKNNTVIYVSIVLSIVIIGVFIVLLIKRRNKEEQVDM